MTSLIYSELGKCSSTPIHLIQYHCPLWLNDRTIIFMLIGLTAEVSDHYHVQE